MIRHQTFLSIFLLSVVTVSLGANAAAFKGICVVKAPVVPITRGYDLVTRKTTIGHLDKGDLFPCDPDNQPEPGIYQVRTHGVIGDLSEDGLYVRAGHFSDLESADYFVQAPEVFLDGSPGEEVAIFEQPLTTWAATQNTSNQSGKIVVKTSITDSSFKFFVRDFDYYDVTDSKNQPILLRNIKVDRVPNNPNDLEAYKRGDWPQNMKSGWVLQSSLRNTPFPPSHSAKPPPTPTEDQTKPCCTDKKDPTREQVENLQRDLMAQQISTRNTVLGHIDATKCFGRRQNLIEDAEPYGLSDLTEGMKKYLRRHPAPDETNLPLGADRVDLVRQLAFTMWGEARGCPPRYRKAVGRIILNRMEALQRHGKVPFTRTCKSSDTESLLSKFRKKPNLAAACTLGAKDQFYVWDGDDINYDYIKCIDRDVPEWKECLEMAYDIVSVPLKFKDETKELEGVLYYTSGTTIDSLEEITRTLSTKEGPLDKKSCLRFWRDPRIKL